MDRATLAADAPAPFSHFADPVPHRGALRRAITASCRTPEPECLPHLLALARLAPEQNAAAATTATRLVEGWRQRQSGSGIQALMHEYALSSQEGIALMCVAEALLRIPDAAVRDALIRDKLSAADWAAHLGAGRSLFVNAATWALVITGKLSATSTIDGEGLMGALGRLLARCGEPVVRQGVDMAMRMLGEHFVMGQTIAEALARGAAHDKRVFRYSFDMLGEAATTAEDAARYTRAYEAAIHAIGAASAGRGVVEGPGVSIKLSALHPRYARAQAGRVMRELLPRLTALAKLARHYEIGLNIDAEEADRLELSLDLLEALANDEALAGWQGLGFVVQAYGKRSPQVIDFVIDLARRTGRRLMLRLVKGAYWDSEIKRAQVDGLPGFPVFTRKVYTDVCYLACARKLLAARDAVFPQFATHNARTVAAVLEMAGASFAPGDYEFQCLHGMGEALYEEVIGTFHRPCRIYAPVGTHETLLAYLVRRLLENGANSSFVNRLADPDTPIAELIADPVVVAASIEPPGAPHPGIAAPADLYLPARANSAGIDLTDEDRLTELGAALRASAAVPWRAGEGAHSRPVLNPADRRDQVGFAADAGTEEVSEAVRRATSAAAGWALRGAESRAAILERAAVLMQQRMPALMGLIMREAGKSAANAIAEVREAVDFLRYYAVEARRVLAGNPPPLGVVASISPWNFPLAIFTGQVGAALAAGNAVLAKPAEETPLIAAEAVRLLHEAGVPAEALQLVIGDGLIGAALVADARVNGVLFTGSTEVARSIQRSLADRIIAGRPVPLIAETGGQNAMVVDSAALPEQVVADVLASAFDSAGQRCSALRVLCLQQDVAGRILEMLAGAMAELSIGRTDRLAIDIGPVITDAAKAAIEADIAAMRGRGHRITQAPLPSEVCHGSFVAPAIVEIATMEQVEREVFGPVLHVLRYRREELPRLLESINATGYGLTFGLHTRLDETVALVRRKVMAGNIYVNRNIIGAVVGVQPFGGRGLSGTGPKAGGPLYLTRLIAGAPSSPPVAGTGTLPPVLTALANWLEAQGEQALADCCRATGLAVPLGHASERPGPVGERNIYALEPGGRVLLLPASRDGLFRQLAAALAACCTAEVADTPLSREVLRALPSSVAQAVILAGAELPGRYTAALVEGGPERVRAAAARIAAWDGPIVPLHVAGPYGSYRPELLLREVSVSINTAAAGGNASLMATG